MNPKTQQYILYFLEFFGLFGLIGLLAFVSWTKMVLGAVLAVIGAFFPQMNNRYPEVGEGNITFGKFSAVFKGSLRFAVTIGGLILITFSLKDGYTNWVGKGKPGLSMLDENEAKTEDLIVSAYELKMTKLKLRKCIYSALEMEDSLKLIDMNVRYSSSLIHDKDVLNQNSTDALYIESKMKKSTNTLASNEIDSLYRQARFLHRKYTYLIRGRYNRSLSPTPFSTQ